MSSGRPELVGEVHPSTTHGSPAADACSVLWDGDGTSAFGTAASAAFFVIVEQPGPWGRDAARESHLDHNLGAELDSRTGGGGGRFMLIRRPGGHPAVDGPRRVYLAHAGRGPVSGTGDDTAPVSGGAGDHTRVERDGGVEPWLLEADLSDVADLLALDWESLADGDRDRVTASVPVFREADPVLLVCTNGRRDVCCAVRGRPLAAAAAHAAPGRVWEVSHTGGHRFAPTAVLLPWGQTYARVDEQSAALALQAALTGHTPSALLGPLHDRGRSALPAPAQCAESHVRTLVDETHLGSLWASSPTPVDDGHDVVVAHVDGRRWRVRVMRAPAGRTRPESCGKGPVEVLEQRATDVTLL